MDQSLGQKYFVCFLVQMSTGQSAFEMYWPLVWSSNKSTGKETGKMHLCALQWSMPYYIMRKKTTTSLYESTIASKNVQCKSRLDTFALHIPNRIFFSFGLFSLSQ